MTADRNQKDDAVHQADPPATEVPTRWVGPLRLSGNAVTGDVEVPLATYETPLWPSVGRGARVSQKVDGGIRAVVVDERMTRSVLFVAPDAQVAYTASEQVSARLAELQDVVTAGSRYARLLEAHPEIEIGRASCRERVEGWEGAGAVDRPEMRSE